MAEGSSAPSAGVFLAQRFPATTAFLPSEWTEETLHGEGGRGRTGAAVLGQLSGPWLPSRKAPVESLSAPIEGATSARLKPRSHFPSSQRWACHSSTPGPGHHEPLKDGGQGLGKPNPLPWLSPLQRPPTATLPLQSPAAGGRRAWPPDLLQI